MYCTRVRMTCCELCALYAYVLYACCIYHSFWQQRETESVRASQCEGERGSDCERPIETECVVGWVYSRMAACRTSVLLANVVVHNGVEVHLRRDAVLFLVPVRKRFVCLRKLAISCQRFRMRERLGNFWEGESPCVHVTLKCLYRYGYTCSRALVRSLSRSFARIPAYRLGQQGRRCSRPGAPRPDGVCWRLDFR